MLKRFLFILIAVVLAVGGGYIVWGRLQETVKVDPPQMVAVRRDTFVHEILGRGSVDSAQNVEVRVKVESARQGGLTIVTVIPEGTLVKTGDLLVELDSAWLREQTERQQVTVIASESKLAQSKADLKTAELAHKEYLEGTLEQQRKTIESEIFTAREQVRTLEDQAIYVKRQFDRGYITDAKVDSAMIDLKKAELNEELAVQKLRVLEKYTKEKMLTEFQAAIDAATAKVEADEQTLKIDTARWEHYKTQLANCTITAPCDGQVVYYMPRWGGDENLIREGKGVSDKEILLLLPDPTQMQVKGLVNEANVRYVRPGQKATIRLEAFLNQTFEGEVRIVNHYPEPGGFMGQSMSREYLTTVRILNPPEGVRTGLTAEARIVVNEIPDALLLPAQAVLTHGGKTYAITYKEGKWDKVEINVGHANDKNVVILEGLNEGDEVVLGAWVHREKVDLPKVVETPRPDMNPAEKERLLEQMRREQLPQQGGTPGAEGSGPGSDAGGTRPGGGAPSGGAPGGGVPSGGAPGGGGPRGPR